MQIQQVNQINQKKKFAMLNFLHVKLQFYIIVIPSLMSYVYGQNRLPTPPKVIFGGFIPILSDNKFERNPKSLTKYIDTTSRLSVDPTFPICKFIL